MGRRVTVLAGALLAVSLAAGCAGEHRTASPTTTTTASNPATRIVIGRRIGPISLLESKAKIKAAYGRGQQETLDTGPTVTFYPAVSIAVNYYGGTTVGSVETTSPLYRTPSGVGVGSGVEALRKSGVQCGASTRFCSSVTYPSPGHPGSTTQFEMKHARVVGIEMSLVS